LGHATKQRDPVQDAISLGKVTLYRGEKGDTEFDVIAASTYIYIPNFQTFTL
jgi:hypothetical protein